MSDFHDADYSLYNLTDGNPYIHRELDARRADHRCYLLDFDGFPSLDDIDGYIRQRVDEKQPAAFLVSGREGTGRTTLARRILHQYAEHRGVGETFHVVTVNDIDHDSRSRTNRLIKAIRNTVIRNGNWANHRDSLMREVPDGGGPGLEDLDLQSRAEYLNNYAENIVKPPVHIGLLIDGVQEDAFMDTLAVVFENVQMAVVVTRDHYEGNADTASAERLAQRKRWQRWARSVTLPALSGDSVELLASNRWQIAAPEVECPFDLEGLRRTFTSRSSPVARVLGWLGFLLHWRLIAYEGTERWPQAGELSLPGRWIETMVRQVEMANEFHGRPPGD
ncbi:ATP-binding protein [Micromonospora sp. R77]|uniref:ATP-binding protein n=1 Tax=Micromonospora sp. R77 TaxID=2925836 RepID=UPI001F618959|nr:ATP-binding protein [Micromonospora sp. R77]MCI4065124.1 ATP-binding protein [Micromonospora sp. R77]